MPDIFNIGVSGLNTAQVALSTISHNIAHVNTQSFTRQRTSQAAMVPQSQSFGFIGLGAEITQVTRLYNKYLSDQVLSAHNASSFNQAELLLLSQVDNLLANTSLGLNPSLQNFFASLQTLALDPKSIPSRQNMLSSAQALVGQFQLINNRLSEIQNGTNTEIIAAVNSVNALAQKIANLNQQIAALSAGSPINVPNDLLDQRDETLRQLAQLVKASYVEESNGSIEVFIGNGQTLVQGSTTISLGTQPDPANPNNVQIYQAVPTGGQVVIPDSLMSGGSLGGYLDFRNNTLLQTQIALGNIAIDLSTAMNYQQKLGLDLNGNTGSALFTDLTSYAANPQNAVAFLQVLLSDPRTLAAASNLSAGALSPSGSGVVVNSVFSTLPGSYGWTNPSTPPSLANHPSQGFSTIVITATTASNISATITGGPAAGSYSVVNDGSLQNGYKLVTGVLPPADVGIAFSLSAQMQAGMSFTLTPNTLATLGNGDNSNLLQMGYLQTRSLVDNTRNGTTTGLQTFQEAYTTAIGIVGNETATIKLDSEAAETLLEQTSVARSNVSGVNLDQEAANLIRYQQAYQASSKVISVAQTLFQQILQLT